MSIINKNLLLPQGSRAQATEVKPHEDNSREVENGNNTKSVSADEDVTVGAGKRRIKKLEPLLHSKTSSICSGHPILQARLQELSHAQLLAKKDFDKCFDKSFDKVGPFFDKSFDRDCNI